MTGSESRASPRATTRTTEYARRALSRDLPSSRKAASADGEEWTRSSKPRARLRPLASASPEFSRSPQSARRCCRQRAPLSIVYRGSEAGRCRGQMGQRFERGGGGSCSAVSTSSSDAFLAGGAPARLASRCAAEAEIGERIVCNGRFADDRRLIEYLRARGGRRAVRFSARETSRLEDSGRNLNRTARGAHQTAATGQGQLALLRADCASDYREPRPSRSKNSLPPRAHLRSATRCAPHAARSRLADDSSSKENRSTGGPSRAKDRGPRRERDGRERERK